MTEPADVLTVHAFEGVRGEVTIANPQPHNIVFYMDNVEVLRITKDRIIGNPKVHADEAATAILRALENQIRALK